MIMDLKKMNYYFLTTGTAPNKAKHVLQILKDYNITEINPVLKIGKQKSGSIGHCRMIDHGLKDQDRNQPFQPFIILEDDVSFYRELPKTIDIPDDADILYIGLSMAAIDFNDGYKPTNTIYATNINDNCIRVYNMLSTHAIMICSARGAATYQRCMMENYYKNCKGWDVPLSRIQPFYNVYALKIPLFYQDKKYGGVEWATKVKFENNKIIPNQQKLPNNNKVSRIYKEPPSEFRNSFNNKFVSILMCSN